MSRSEAEGHMDAAVALIQRGMEGNHEAQAQFDYMRSASRRQAGAPEE